MTDPDDAVVTDYKSGRDFGFTYRGREAILIAIYVDGEELVCEIREAP